MKNSSKPKDKINTTCLVCGKFFTHGILDLKRHITAITLQHIISKKSSSSFQFSCPNKCGIYFREKAHVEMHLKQACIKKVSKKELKALETSSSMCIEQSNKSDINKEEDIIDDSYSDTKINSTNNLSKKATQECMVCGKLFLRGPIDLARHTNAITLKHLTSVKYTATFQFGCKKCGLYFNCEDHLQTHRKQSTCNSDMIWPINSNTASGLRSISKSEYEKQIAAGVVSTTSLLSFVARLTSSSTSSSNASLNNKSSSKSIIAKDISSCSASKLSLTQYDTSATDAQSLRSKKAKVIVPDDRKAFFAVISLLIESVPESEKLTENNYEQYIPEKYKVLVQSMKENLLYSCN